VLHHFLRLLLKVLCLVIPFNATCSGFSRFHVVRCGCVHRKIVVSSIGKGMRVKSESMNFMQLLIVVLEANVVCIRVQLVNRGRRRDLVDSRLEFALILV